MELSMRVPGGIWVASPAEVTERQSARGGDPSAGASRDFGLWSIIGRPAHDDVVVSLLALETRRAGRRQRAWTAHRVIPTLLGALALSTVVGSSVDVATGASNRDELSLEVLVDGEPGDAELVDNAAFLPSGDAGPARHTVEGRFIVDRLPLQISTNESRYRGYRYFPGFSVDFFTHDGHLVPVTRSLITKPQIDSWSLILSPGRIWSEPGDDGKSRASFPFTLGSPWDRPYSGGESHNGVATFLIDNRGVSDLRLQVTQETAPDGDIFDMWGQLPLDYEPGSIPGIDGYRADFELELADRVMIRPWSDLEERFDASQLAALSEGLPPEVVSAAGVVVDGVVYLQSSWTRRGLYPYPTYMHHGAMSVSKSIGAGVAMLWLAQEYGPEVFDLRITDYVEIDVGHDGWEEVTFGDVLDMATGVGDNSPDPDSFDVHANESGPSYDRFYSGETVGEKLDAALSVANYPWGPGEVLRYTSAQTFVLAAAMDTFLQRREGPEARLWDRLHEAVFAPIGVHHLTMIHVPDEDGGAGVPLLASGLRLTVDDLAKIVGLLQNGGVHAGQQLLHPELVDAALYRTGQPEGLPSGKRFDDGDQAYQMSFWSLAHRAADGSYFQVPFMSGAGGNTVFLAPNGVTTFVFTDHGEDTYSLNSPAVAETIRSFPDTGLDNVDLVDHSDPTWPLVAVAIIAAALAASVNLMIRHHRRRGPQETTPTRKPGRSPDRGTVEDRSASVG
jgi:CubicO group peptidase (beta-lactamase class C family)